MQQQSVRLSIIIAAYNHEKFVRKTIDSILNQTFTDFEVIAIDDGSKDATLEILKEYISHISLIQQDNKGVVATRMEGIHRSRGEYVAFIDSDDIISPDRFEKQVRLLDTSHRMGLVFSDADIINENGTKIGKFSDLYKPYLSDIAKHLFCNYCFIPAITVTFRRSFFEQTGPLWGPGPICDYLKWIEIALISDIGYIPESLGSWRRHQQSVSFSADVEKQYLKQFEALKTLCKKHQDLAEMVKRCAPRRYSRLHFLIAFFSVLSKDYSKAQHYFKKAIQLYPWGFENWTGYILSHIPIRAIPSSIFNIIYKRIYKWR